VGGSKSTYAERSSKKNNVGGESIVRKEVGGKDKFNSNSFHDYKECQRRSKKRNCRESSMREVPSKSLFSEGHS